MILNMNDEYRKNYLASLEEKALTQSNLKRGCLSAALFTLGLLMLIVTGMNLMIPGEAGTIDYTAFGISVIVFIISVVMLIAAAKKSRASKVTVADTLRERYGDAVFKEVKDQVLSENTYIFTKNDRQKDNLLYLTDSWLVYGGELIKISSIMCAYQAKTSARTGNVRVNMRYLFLLLENNDNIVDFPLDYSEDSINEMIALINQKNKYTFTDITVKTNETIVNATINLDNGEKLKLSSDKDKINELYIKRASKN